MFGARLLPGAGGLSADAVAVLGVFFGSLIMWIGISIDWPSMITLLALGLLPVFGFGPTLWEHLEIQRLHFDLYIYVGISAF